MHDNEYVTQEAGKADASATRCRSVMVQSKAHRLLRGRVPSPLDSRYEGPPVLTLFPAWRALVAYEVASGIAKGAPDGGTVATRANMEDWWEGALCQSDRHMAYDFGKACTDMLDKELIERLGGRLRPVDGDGKRTFFTGVNRTPFSETAFTFLPPKTLVDNIDAYLCWMWSFLSVPYPDVGLYYSLGGERLDLRMVVGNHSPEYVDKYLETNSGVKWKSFDHDAWTWRDL